MDAELGTLLKRAETAIAQSRRVLSVANWQIRATQDRVLRTRDLVNEDWYLHLHAALLQKRSGRLLWQASTPTDQQ